MEYKVNFGDPKTGKTVKKVISDKEAEFFLKKRIGDKIKGDDFGFEGYEFEITGGSDYCGFPMRKDVIGASRKRILVVGGVGIRKNKKSRKGKKTRKTVAGNTIHSKTAQINLKILKIGSKPLAEEKEEASPAPEDQGKAPKQAEKAPKKAPEAKKEEKKPEAPKEEKKEDKPKSEPKKEDKKAAGAEPKGQDEKPEAPKPEQKPAEPKKKA